MNVPSEFLIYATLFRLAIIGAGVVSVVLGYRLFTLGVQTDRATSKETTLEAKVAGQGFTLKNAAPGTGFGLFGVIIISVMLVQGSPELTLKTFNQVPGVVSPGSQTEVTVRGGAPAGSGKWDAAIEKGFEYDRKGDTIDAVASYEEALTLLAAPMNDLAWDYLQQGDTERALPLSRLAVQLCPSRAAFIETLAEILAKDGNRAEALKWMGKAAALDPKYQQKLSELQRPGR
jgi:tetratricopeptide (TPR) repeat protein